jgi:hypothetical protein
MPKILTNETTEKIMSYPEDMTHAEIAKECGVSTTTVLNYRGPSPHSGWEKIIESKLGSKAADSDEVAQAFRNDAARRYAMMPPGSDASLAGELCHPILRRSIAGEADGDIVV